MGARTDPREKGEGNLLESWRRRRGGGKKWEFRSNPRRAVLQVECNREERTWSYHEIRAEVEVEVELVLESVEFVE